MARVVKLPRSAARRDAQTWAKLLTRVDPHAQSGFGFEGRILRPGSVVNVADLPRPAVLLEYAGSVYVRADGEPGKPAGHNRAVQLYVLWVYNFGLDLWQELGRQQAANADWVYGLREMAFRALDQPCRPARHACAGEVLRAIDLAIEGITPATAGEVLDALHRRLAARAAAAA